MDGLQNWGAAGFGAVIGWYLYFINRYRKGDVQIGDLTTVIGAIGGGAVLGIFGQKPEMFGAYGIGLAVGFFGYFLVLVFLVGHSKSFTSDWFLDGRRPNPPDGWGYAPDAQQTVRSMEALQGGVLPGGTQNFYISPAPAGGAFVAPAQAAPRGGRRGEKVETQIVGS
jgi:hypothetical protein